MFISLAAVVVVLASCGSSAEESVGRNLEPSITGESAVAEVLGLATFDEIAVETDVAIILSGSKVTEQHVLSSTEDDLVIDVVDSALVVRSETGRPLETAALLEVSGSTISRLSISGGSNAVVELADTPSSMAIDLSGDSTLQLTISPLADGGTTGSSHGWLDGTTSRLDNIARWWSSPGW